jgi:dsDNA-binding SOS-regulon protein
MINVEQIEISPSYNNPKTYAIVYKGTDNVVVRMGEEMYFRSKRTADEFMYILEIERLDEEFELLQLKPNKLGERLSQTVKQAKNGTSRIVREPSGHPKREYKRKRPKLQ